MTTTESRFVVRHRADGFAVVDTLGLQLERKFLTTATAAEMARSLNAEEGARTYGLTWYVEVDAMSEEAAVKNARKYLAAAYREDWEPLSVDLVEP